MSPLWLYGVLAGGQTKDLGLGMAGEPLRIVEHASLAAVVGDLPELPHLTRQALEGHDAVVRRLAESHESLLPARFGQRLGEEEGLRRELDAREKGLTRALELVAGCSQMTLRLFGEEEPSQEAGSRRGGEVEPEAAEYAVGLGEGTRYLGERLRLQQRRHSLPEASELLAALAPRLRAQRIHREGEGRLLGTVYHLVPRDQIDDYRRLVVSRRRRMLPLHVVLAGPAPAYAFAPEEGS